MTKYLSIKEVQAQLENLPEEIKQEPIIITKSGKPVMVTIAYEQIESLLETLEIIEDKEFSNQLEASIKQETEDRAIDWEEAKKILGWE